MDNHSSFWSFLLWIELEIEEDVKTKQMCKLKVYLSVWVKWLKITYLLYLLISKMVNRSRRKTVQLKTHLYRYTKKWSSLWGTFSGLLLIFLLLIMHTYTKLNSSLRLCSFRLVGLANEWSLTTGIVFTQLHTEY